MKKAVVKNVVPEEKEKTQALSDYKQDLLDIKKLLADMLEKLDHISLNGGFE